MNGVAKKRIRPKAKLDMMRLNFKLLFLTAFSVIHVRPLLKDMIYHTLNLYLVNPHQPRRNDLRSDAVGAFTATVARQLGVVFAADGAVRHFYFFLQSLFFLEHYNTLIF